MTSPITQASHESSDPPQATWLNQKERGALLGIRLVFFLATAFGRAPAGLFLRVVALWYALFDQPAKRASKDFLGRALGREATFADVYRHIFCFARVTLDRAFLLRGRSDLFKVTNTGNEHLQKLTREKRGALLLGGHLGSFEAMRVGASEEEFPINIVGHFANARMINALLEQLNPELAARVLHVGDDPAGTAITMRERLESGEMLAVLGDRVGLNDKHIAVNFFGQQALMPTGPFLLAAALKCPLYLVFGLYSEPNHYDLYCEPFLDKVVLPRNRRQEALHDVTQRFAERLEHYAKLAPYNWFNFFDFWQAPKP